MNAVPYRLRGHGFTGTATDYWHGHGLPQRALRAAGTVPLASRPTSPRRQAANA